jgi:hypothetical protein
MGYARVVLEGLETGELRVTGGTRELRDWDCSCRFAGRCRRIFRSYVMALPSVLAELGGCHKRQGAFRRLALVVALGCQMLNKSRILLETLLAYFTLYSCYVMGLFNMLASEVAQYGKWII